MNCCERCENALAHFGVFAVNLVDFVLGCLLLAFGFYISLALGPHSEEANVVWLQTLSIIVGILLLLIVSLSFSAIYFTYSCKCGILVSGYLALLLSFLAMITVIVALALRGEFFGYLNEKGSSIGLSDSDVQNIEDFYYFVVFALFLSCFIELLRFQMSKLLYSNFIRIEGNFQKLLGEEDEDYEIRLNANMIRRAEKYDSMRSYYKSKYSNDV
jgi:membrane-associated HD superfamily phosphohydrolase